MHQHPRTMATKKGNTMCVWTHLYTKTKAAEVKRLTGADVVGAEFLHPKDGPRQFIRFIFRKQPS